jgi:hypothetical protein
LPAIDFRTVRAAFRAESLMLAKEKNEDESEKIWNLSREHRRYNSRIGCVLSSRNLRFSDWENA